MRDFEAFQEALLERRQTHGEEDGPAYMDSLMNSMSLVLDEFYKHLRVRTAACARLASQTVWALFGRTVDHGSWSCTQAVGVSAMTGEGMDELFDAVREAREEYEKDYKPELEKIVAERVRLYITFARPSQLTPASYSCRNARRKRRRPTRSRA
jgi:putative protein kinase ArgK-like GTPase of G3E family